MFRPQTGYYEDPIVEATALLELVQNHLFLDGNKRTSVAVVDAHLRLNRLLGGDSMRHHRRLVSLMERGNLDWRAIDAWLRDDVEES